MNIIERLILKVIQSKIEKWFDLERSLEKLNSVFKSSGDSPEKSWPNPNKIPSGEEVPFSLRNMPIVGKSLSSCVKQGMKAINSIKENPDDSKMSININELIEFQKEAKRNGIGAIGYCKLPNNLIFKERAVLYNYAIVLTMEMEKEAIVKAPSLDTFKMVMSTYDSLGIITNKLTNKLRNMGFQAQASHPLGGLVLYPPLAVKAGLGWCGRHGLLITPEFGSRQRIAAIFVNIDNLPLSKNNEHIWIEEFCKKCGNCIRTCPEKAIFDKPIIHASGRKTQIDREKCLPSFVNREGCTICIKECAFTKANYYDLHKKFIASSTAKNTIHEGVINE